LVKNCEDYEIESESKRIKNKRALGSNRPLGSCYHCFLKDHDTSDCPYLIIEKRIFFKGIKCFVCKGYGHSNCSLGQWSSKKEILNDELDSTINDPIK